jgi:hypothetical protein
MIQETISIFFNGTAHSDTPESETNVLVYSLANLLHRQLINKKMSLLFPGVGTIHPIRGTLFGTGMSEQIQTALVFILGKIKPEHHLVINLFGHSRGAISALILTQKLAKIDPKQLSIHLMMHDPIPGNLISASKIDTLKLTLANQAMNLKHCKNLKKVLTLYPNCPFKGYNPLALAHAPLFPSYPDESMVHEEIIPGTHSESQFGYYCQGELCFSHPGAFIAYHAATKFMTENQTILHMPNKFYYLNPKLKEEIEISSSNMRAGLLKAYRDASAETKEKSIKIGHGQTGKLIATYPHSMYFNGEHLMLERKSQPKTQVRFEERPNSLDLWYPFIFAGLLATTSSSLLFSITNMGVLPSILIGTSLMLIYLTPQWSESRL